MDDDKPTVEEVRDLVEGYLQAAYLSGDLEATALSYKLLALTEAERKRVFE